MAARDDLLRASRALAADARRQAETLETALNKDAKRHDPIIIAARHAIDSAEASLRFYSDWLNARSHTG